MLLRIQKLPALVLATAASQDEAIIAAAVLKMYEAALSKNKEEARTLILFEFPFMDG